MRRNICFIGKAGAGKSTAAALVAGAGYTRLSFAQPLKDIAAQIWGEEAHTDRTKLIGLGMAVRALDPDAWANLLVREVPHHHQAVVIDDCRFENEYWPLKGAGFVFIRVQADEDERVRRLQGNGKIITVEQMQSPSECELDSVVADYIISNNGDYDTFLAAVAGVVGRINAN
jgi:dephospho-CoA kinase